MLNVCVHFVGRMDEDWVDNSLEYDSTCVHMFATSKL